jgi:hypothetical protein
VSRENREVWVLTGHGGALLAGLDGDVVAFATEALAREAIGRYLVVPPDPKASLGVVRFVRAALQGSYVPAPAPRKRRKKR